MRLVITERDLSPVSHLTVSGELDLATAGRLVHAVRDSVGGRVREVSLDLAGVTFMDSSGLHALSTSQRLLTRAEGRLRVVALSPAVERVLTPGCLRRALTAPGLVAS